jgi:hypothetical protein
LSLHDYYFHDPRVVLVPIEHLSADGVSPEFVELLAARTDWSPERIAVLCDGFALYWRRGTAIADTTETWPRPRLRHIAVVSDAESIHPYSGILASAWTLYECDLDPDTSHAEFVAAALVVNDFMMYLGEVARAPIFSAAYWLSLQADEIAAFVAAAKRSKRPDGAAWSALADATPWLPGLHHEALNPPPLTAPGQTLPGTGLIVPQRLGERLVALGEAWRQAANGAMNAFQIRFGTSDFEAVGSLCRWLTEDAPPLIITVDEGRVLWSADASKGVGKLRSELKRRGGAAVSDIAADLHLIAAHTRRFLQSVDASALPEPGADIEASGYSYLGRDHQAISYNLDEPTVDRRHGPALPFARAMLGARTIHEWGHLATDAGWVPQTGSDIEVRNAALAAELEAAIDAAPEVVRMVTAQDLHALADPAPGSEEDRLPNPPGVPASPAGGLVRLLYSRMSDFQSNLVAAQFLATAEMETYVRQNIRQLRNEYESPAFWRMVVRHLYEFQYLRFSTIEDKREYFFRATACDRDFFATDILTPQRFDTLIAAVADICDTFAVDASRIRID